MQASSENFTDSDQIQERVRRALKDHEALRPVGGETQSYVGYEPERHLTYLSTLGLNRIVEYNPDDLVCVAQAGVRFGDLQRALAGHRQWLPLDPSLPERQTLGGIVATRAHSALRAGYGSTRDWLIGVEVVDARAERVRGGGKVVKNVSGYDLPKLYCGSWGTLGIITEVAFKVAPLPEARQALLVLLAPDRNSEEAVDALLVSEQPTSAHLFNAEAAKTLLGPDAQPAQYLCVRYNGTHEAVEAQVKSTARVLGPHAVSVLPLPEPVQSGLAAVLRDFPDRPSALSARFHILSSQVGAYSRMIEWTAHRAGLSVQVLADVVTGIVHACYQETDAGTDWQRFYADFKDKADRVGGSTVLGYLPAQWRASRVPIWSPELPDWAIMRRIKATLDPDGMFSPGTYLGGI